MALLPKVKLKAMLSFPSAILDGAGIDVTRINGAFKFNIAFDDFAPPVSGIADPAHTNALLWNSATNAYVLAPVSILGSAGTVPEAPNDGVQYGRQSNTWTPVSTGSTIPPATVLPIMDGAAAIGTTTKYAREDHVHPSDTSRAPTVHSHVAANVTDFSEAVDDRVSGLLVAGSNITLTYDDPGNTLTVTSTAPGVADGDKGDITVSGSGTTWTIDPNTVSNTKLAQMPLFTIKANNTGFSAVPTDINIASLTTKTPAGADYLLLSDTTASGALKKTLISALPGGTSIGEAPTDGAVYSRQGSSASWVIAGGFPDGDKGDVTITSSGTVWTIDADTVTFAKMQNIATDSLIGRDTTGTGDPENITLGASLSMSGAQVLQRAALTGDVTATVDSNATTIANGTVTLAKMANLTAPVFVGRTILGAGVPEALTPTQATAMLNVFASSLKGLVPSPAGATTTFLRADGTWAVSDDSTKVAKAGDTMTGPLNQSSPGHWAFQAPGAGSFYSSISTPDRFFVGTDLSADSFRIFSTGPAANALIVDGPTGRVTVAVDPTDPLGVATKQYVDAGDVAGLAAAGMQINGGMEVSQERGTNPVNGSAYILDGWRHYTTGVQFVTIGQVNDAPPGFSNSIRVLVGTANASPAASDYLQIVQYIEGYRIARLAFGTATARPITLAFWVKAHRTGTYSGSISNNASGGAARFYTFTFTLSVADTWEYKTVTIPGDVTGTWQTTNVSGLVLSVCIMSGSTYLGTPNVWGSTSYVGATGQINGVAATSDVFYITGVVVLPGTQAPTAAQSPLIMRPYDQELMTCFRYWRRFNLGSAGYKNAGNTTGVFYAMTPMRSTPTISVLSSGNVSVDGAISRSALPDGINITFVAASVGGYILNEMLALDARL